MSVIDRRKQLVRLTKQQLILEASIGLIAKLGINNVNMDNIALAANYTKRTLYEYFKSKDEILLSVHTADLNKRWIIQKEHLKKGKTGLDKLLIWSNSFYEYCNKNTESMQIQTYMDYKFVQVEKVDHLIFQKFEQINNELANGLRSIFELGSSDGSIRNDIDVDMTIKVFLYSYRAVLNKALSGSYSFANSEKTELINHFLELFTTSIKKEVPK